MKDGVFNTPPHVYSCSSIPIFDSKRYITFHKIFVANNDETVVELIITYEKIDNDECNMKFARGFMYCNNVEYVIDTFLHFQMLQYGLVYSFYPGNRAGSGTEPGTVVLEGSLLFSETMNGIR